MAKKMLIDATHAEETRVVVVDGNKVEEFDFESENKRQLAGNIYLAKVTRVEPSLQAAFVDYGGNRHGFLAFSEIHPDYYQIPVADREALMEEERAYAEAMKARDDEDEKPKSRSRSRSRSRSKSKAAEIKTSDAVETKEVPTEEISGEISGMETIDLTGSDEAPEGTSPMELVAETPVEEPVTDENSGAAEAPAAEAQPETPDQPETAPEGEAAVAEAAVETTGEADTAADDAVASDADSAEAAPQDEAKTDADTAEANGDAADEAAQQKSSASEKDDNIESVADDDDADDIRPPRKPRPRRYKIQEVIKVRQILLVQVVKEERGNKGAALTTYLSLAGRYCVLMPNTARGGGISRKITNAADRKKLKEIANEIDVPQGAGLIIRTAGAKRTKSEIKRDYEYLQRLWEQIRELTLKSVAPAKIYEEGDLIKRSIRDLYNREIDEVFVEGERGYRIAKDFMKMIMPSHAKNVKHYTDQMPLFARYQVESYLGAMFNPTVQLKSGGYIVIGVTEALVAIDVNSGRATKEGSIEETALKTNLEAAEEVARQLRLRDLAGLIVIDFIDMDERRNNTAVEKRIKDKLKTDRARIQVGRISGFGLLEMSRQRLRPGMIEATTAPCPSCHGTGLIRSDDNLALSILRQIEEEGVRRRSREVLVKCPVGIANFLMNQKRDHVAQIEGRYGLSVRIEGDPMLISPDFVIEKFKSATRVITETAAPVVSVDTSLMDQIDETTQEEPQAEAAAEAGEEAPKPKKRRRRRRRRSSSKSTTEGANGEEAADQNASEGTETPSEEQQADGNGADTSTADTDAKSDAAEPTSKPKSSRSRSSRSKKPTAVATEDVNGTEASQEQTSEPAADTAPAAAAEPVQETAPVEAQPETVEQTPEETVEAPAAETLAEEVQAEEVRAEEVRAEEAPAEAEAPAPTAEPAAEIVVETQPEPTPEPVVEEVAPTPAPEPDTPPKPKRRGWWSLGS